MSTTPKRVLVLGASGMAGHVVTAYLRDRGYAVTATSGHHAIDGDTRVLDVRDEVGLGRFLRSQSPHAVVNCVGALVAASNSEPAMAAYLNAYLPHRLAEIYRHSETRVIHLSTDCVFSGDRGGYNEYSVPDAQDFYGRSKALGEIENAKDVTLRMSIIGPEIRPHGTGLMNWFLRSSGDIQGYTGAMWNGITTLQLAAEVEHMIETPTLAGIVHPVSESGLSKFRLLELFAETFGVSDVSIHPVTDKRVDKRLVRTRDDYRSQIPGYPQMLQDLKAWILAHEGFYSQQPWFARVTR